MKAAVRLFQSFNGCALIMLSQDSTAEATPYESDSGLNRFQFQNSRKDDFKAAGYEMLVSLFKYLLNLLKHFFKMLKRRVLVWQ